MGPIDLLSNSSDKYPDKIAVRYAGRAITYARLAERIDRLADAMRTQADVRPRDRVVVWSKNCSEFIEILFATIKIGAVPELYNARWSASLVCSMVRETAPKMAFVSIDDDPCARTAECLAAEGAVRVVMMGGRAEGCEGFEGFLDRGRLGCPTYRLEDDDVVLQLFTSGTTSVPKAVMLTCENVMVQTAISAMEERWAHDDVALGVFPLYHVSGFFLFKAFYVGAEIVLGSSTRIDEIASLVQTFGVTRMSLPPALLQRLVDCVEGAAFDMSSLRVIAYGSSPMSPSLMERCKDVLPCGFHQAYGMTETTGSLTALLPEDHQDGSLLDTVGRPLLGVRIRIADDEGRALPPGEEGQILACSRTVMKGYRNSPEKTAEVLEDGWYHTGDMGFIDARGYLHLCGRRDGMIISGGENVYPLEVANCIRSMDGVVDAEVVGVDDDRWGQTLAAFIVKRPDSALSVEAVAEQCARKLARYKKPRHVYFVDKFPRGGVGKVSANDLRALHERLRRDERRSAEG